MDCDVSVNCVIFHCYSCLLGAYVIYLLFSNDIFLKHVEYRLWLLPVSVFAMLDTSDFLSEKMFLHVSLSFAVEHCQCYYPCQRPRCWIPTCQTLLKWMNVTTCVRVVAVEYRPCLLPVSVSAVLDTDMSQTLFKWTNVTACVRVVTVEYW
jgi:hypothetical protein